MFSNNEPSQHENSCRICLSKTFESDATKIDRAALEPDADVSIATISQLVSPCRCIGSVGYMHKGCLLLEVQHRKSSTCQLCKTKYRFLEISKTQNNSLLTYITSNLLRSLATMLYFLAIPLFTTLWFCNRLKFCSDREQEWSNASYRVLITKYRDGTRTGVGWSEIRQANPGDEKQRQVIHPLVVLVFSYHADVVWINVVNLLMIQLIMRNLEHYQTWCVEHRPRVGIRMTHLWAKAT